MVAGTLFLLVSLLGIVSVLSSIGIYRPNFERGYTSLLGGVLGFVFLTAGRRVALGQAKDTLAPSLLSILVGASYLWVGWAAFATSERPPREAQQETMIIVAAVAGLVSLVVGVGLFLPAGLGLTGRSRYLKWRAVRPPAPTECGNLTTHDQKPQ